MVSNISSVLRWRAIYRIQPTSRVHCNIGFAELAVNMPDTLVDETVPVLIEILRDVPYIDFDRCLAWDGESTLHDICQDSRNLA